MMVRIDVQTYVFLYHPDTSVVRAVGFCDLPAHLEHSCHALDPAFRSSLLLSLLRSSQRGSLAARASCASTTALCRGLPSSPPPATLRPQLSSAGDTRPWRTSRYVQYVSWAPAHVVPNHSGPPEYAHFHSLHNAPSSEVG